MEPSSSAIEATASPEEKSDPNKHPSDLVTQPSDPLLTTFQPDKSDNKRNVPSDEQPSVPPHPGSPENNNSTKVRFSGMRLRTESESAASSLTSSSSDYTLGRLIFRAAIRQNLVVINLISYTLTGSTVASMGTHICRRRALSAFLNVGHPDSLFSKQNKLSCWGENWQDPWAYLFGYNVWPIWIFGHQEAEVIQ